MHNLLATGVTTLIGSGELTSISNISGNAVESISQHPLVQTAAKVMQSVSLAIVCLWASVHAAFAMNASPTVMSAVAGTTALLALGLPALAELAKRISPQNKESIEAFQKAHATTLKVLNIALSATVFVAGIILSQPISLILLSGLSVFSSAYTLDNR